MAEAKVTLTETNGVIVATVQIAEMDSEIIEALMTHVQQHTLAEKRALLIIDMVKVKFIDSIALGSLVVLLRRVKATNGRLAITGLSGHSHKVLQVTGLDKVFESFDGVESALEEFQRPA